MKSFPVATSENCAAAVLDVVPGVMRSIRCQMRGHSSATLSIVQFRTLSYINRKPGSSLSGVAEHIGLTLPSASKLVQSLLMRGYLTRQIDRRDRRKSALAPTAKGVKILEAARRATHRHLADELSKIPAAERQTIIGAMSALRQVFSCDPCASAKTEIVLKI